MAKMSDQEQLIWQQSERIKELETQLINLHVDTSVELQNWKGQFITEMCLLVGEEYAREDETVSETILRWTKEMVWRQEILRKQNNALVDKARDIGNLASAIETGVWP